MYRRRALIIGNDKYEHMKQSSCVNDAKNFGIVLSKKCKYDVDFQPDMKSEEMHKKISDFIVSIQTKDLIIFYFSGHAIQWRGQNFLLPCDNKNITSKNDVNRYAINAQAIIDDMNEKDPQAIVFLLDCCRTYEMPTASPKKSSSDKQICGLSAMMAPEKALIMFSCGIGEVLPNDIKSENNGLFAKYLIDYINTRNTHIETILFKIAKCIAEETQNNQRPYRTGYLNIEVFLVEPVADASKELPQQLGQSNASSVNPQELIFRNKSLVQAPIHVSQSSNKTAVTREPDSNCTSASMQVDANSGSKRMAANNFPIRRKAIDVTGRLGTTYDALCDKLGRSENSLSGNIRPCTKQTPQNCSTCKIFSGNQMDDLFDEINLDEAIRQSLCLEMIQPSGVSSFINYNEPINENTRFLYYSYTSKTEQFEFTSQSVEEIRKRYRNFTDIIHIITKIQWGIDILCIIQLPKSESVKMIDDLLQTISKRLADNENAVVLTPNEKTQLDQLTNVTVYGSQNFIRSICTPLNKILNGLKTWKACHQTYHHPLVYTMHSMSLVSDKDPSTNTLDSENKIDSYIRNIVSDIKHINDTKRKINLLLNYVPKAKSVLNEDLKKLLGNFQVELDRVSKMYVKYQEDCRQIVMNMRRNASDSKEVDTLILDKRYPGLKIDFDTLYTHVNEWKFKISLLEQLQTDKISYTTLSQILLHLSQLKTYQEIDDALKLSYQKYPSVILCYSNDQLRQKNSIDWLKKYEELKSYESKKATSAQTIYIDFIGYEHLLPDITIVILPDPKTPTAIMQSSRKQSSSTVAGASNKRSSSSSSPEKELNVLLLGETGVGKSTFINAFFNYFTYDSLENAEKHGVVHIISGSFVIAIGNTFDEIVVKYGDTDANENLENEGESVTKQCKSYPFNLKDGLKLNLIDTPGIGDTRGSAQDEINMNHILTYINQLSHINAVCLLLKPNSSKLDVFFRSCVRQLSTYLTSSGHGNIIFCFTNARSTQFALGNSGPLLKQMLKEDEFDGIQFEKETTFFVDNECFRYLAAKKYDVKYNDFIVKDYKSSWDASKKGWNRMLKFIQTLQPHKLSKKKL